MKLKSIGFATFIAAAAAVLVIGSAGPGQAKQKKAAEAAPAQPFCWPGHGGPVCGEKSGAMFTYANSCYAEKDSAKVTSPKACPAMKAHKMHAKKMGKPMKMKMKKEMKKS
jgi:hypothetical protein